MAPAASDAKALNAFLIGNPNTGKTTLFNALTGLRHRVGNYPGVTVETKTAQVRHSARPIAITDVPGTYSLAPRSPDEMLTVDLLLGRRPEMQRPDVVVCIVDASNLERNTYLVTQVFELGIPVVIALNMIDVAAAQEIDIDVPRLSQSMGAEVVPIQANARHGLRELTDAIERAAVSHPPGSILSFPQDFCNAVDSLSESISGNRQAVPRYLVERAILDIDGSAEAWLVEHGGPAVADRLRLLREDLAAKACGAPHVEARARYAWIAQNVRPAVRKPSQRKTTWTDRIDRVLLHPILGTLIFLVVMAAVFQSIYSLAGLLMEPIDAGFGLAADRVGALLPEGPLRSLVTNGVIAGVGSVVIFLPQILILFGFLAILEDSGYMARAAFLMDRLMAGCGLSGKSFVPLMSSFACAIPGIMATRTIESRRDRIATILIAPLMSCSARLPVYTLLIGAFLPTTSLVSVGGVSLVNLQAVTLTAMYLIGLVVAPIVAWTLKRTLLRGETPVFLMELPTYKFPSLETVAWRMVENGWEFLRRAGTLILATAVVIWALQYYPRSPSVAASFASERAALESQRSGSAADEADLDEQLEDLEHRKEAAYQEQSFLGRMGKGIEPVVRPLGWDWRIGMAAIASFPAREVVVAALGTIYSVGSDVNLEDESGRRLEASLRQATWPDGRPVFTIPVALSLLVFFALCCQCAATLVIIRKETNSWAWPALTFTYMTALAYLAALVVYQVASRMD